MNIKIEFVPSASQRYSSAGDWFFDESGNLIIRISNDDPDLPTEDHQVLVAFHELTEVLLCRKRGITQKMVDEFDMGLGSYKNIPKDEESGDQPNAPYRREHRFAMLIEHLMAHEFGMDGYGVVK